MITQDQPRRYLVGVLLLLAVAGAVSTVCVVTSLRWVGTTFPGFFLLGNRVVASVSLPDWPVAEQPQLYQQEVVAVDGQPVTTTEAVYTLIRQQPPFSIITYTFEKNGQRSEIALPSHLFTWQDYVFLFGAALLTGVTMILLGVTVFLLKPSDPAARALFIPCITLSFFCFTVLDLYDPAYFFRLHALCEAVFPFGFAYLGLVFPANHLGRYRTVFLSFFACVMLVLVIAYEAALYQPTRYSLIHSLCMLGVGVGGAALAGGAITAYLTTASHLVKQRIRVIFLGLLTGFAFPSILMGYSGLTGGKVAVNYTAFTAFLFPLSIGYAIVKHDLFDIDALLKRATYYLTLTALLTLSYLTLLTVLHVLLQASDLTDSLLLPLGFTVAVVLVLNPLKDQLQNLVDRLFFRLRYNPQKVLEQTGEALASTLFLDEILSLVWNTIRNNLGVHQGGIALLTPDKQQYVRVYPPGEEARSLSVTHPILHAAQQRRGSLTRYDLDAPLAATLDRDAQFRLLGQPALQLLILMIFKNDVIGVIELSRKESGGFFSVADRDFLLALANQGALAIANALSYQEIQALNASLEQKVAARTQELAQSNTELHSSLARLEQAYQDLQRSQDSLVRAEKMAALGRLTAGIAHEMNTPLGATLTALKLLERLVTEHRVASVQPGAAMRSPQQIDAEMEKLLHVTQQWMDKAASYIRSLKLHTRDLQRGEERPFSVLQTIEETKLLLAHRLRLGQCAVVVSSTVQDPILYGDPGKLGQVLTNLIINAIDAYQVTDAEKGEIRIDLAEAGQDLVIYVKDQGCGISLESLDRIFDEFFSTKPLGEGTGLGLSISRDIVANFFGGTISVASTPGQGSIFTLRLPRHKKRPETPRYSPAETTSSLKDEVVNSSLS